MARTVFTVPVVFLLLLTGCKDPAPLAGDFIGNEAHLETRTIPVGLIESVSEESYTGRHRFMGIGRYDDPLFGEFRSIGIIKPGIDTTKTGSFIDADEQFRLRLVFGQEVYGDTASVAQFDLYPLNEPWRGGELFFGESIPFDETQKVGSFSVGAEDTVEVDLDRAWVEEYNGFLSMEQANRDSIYRDEFYGLAIVPAETVSKVLFAEMHPASGASDDDLKFVRFIAEESESSEDDTRRFQGVNDWGSLQSRTEPEGAGAELFAHSTLDRMIRLEPGFDEQQLGSRNLANVLLVLNQNNELLESSLPEGHVRPEMNRMSIHIVGAGSVNAAVFTRPPEFLAENDEGSFRFDITPWANSLLFDVPPDGAFYLTAGTPGGIIFSTVLFDETAPDEETRPKILITAVKPDLE